MNVHQLQFDQQFNNHVTDNFWSDNTPENHEQTLPEVLFYNYSYILQSIFL